MITRLPVVNTVDTEVRPYHWVRSQLQRDLQAAKTARRPEQNRIEIFGQNYSIVWLKTDRGYIRTQIVRSRNPKTGRTERVTLVHKGRVPLALPVVDEGIDPNLPYEGSR